ncbi:MAG TPA: hypothetical protein VNZ64_21860 [Candidatus Acidoferrum sp.]|jgi:hypothetical protein|nr:hypothetical protein [Candidatus Acidoferrum sp.]
MLSTFGLRSRQSAYQQLSSGKPGVTIAQGRLVVSHRGLVFFASGIGNGISLKENVVAFGDEFMHGGRPGLSRGGGGGKSGEARGTQGEA